MKAKDKVCEKFSGKKQMKASDLLKSGLVGLWSKRHLRDSSKYARLLRRNAETRHAL